MNDEGAISKAWEIASLSHAEQKYGERPYTHHLMVVAIDANLDDRVTEENRTLVCVCAILHDVLEDTATTKNDLRESFKGMGEDFVAGMVDALDRLTKKDVGYNREEYVRGIKGNLVASIVKKADAWCNLSHSIADKHEKRTQKYIKLWKDLEE